MSRLPANEEKVPGARQFGRCDDRLVARVENESEITSDDQRQDRNDRQPAHRNEPVADRKASA